MASYISDFVAYIPWAKDHIVEGAYFIKEYTPTLVLVGFAVFGALIIADKVWSYLRLLGSLFVSPGLKLRGFGKRGSWVLVTGASEGIGKEYAIQLAAHGYNTILVSRTQSKLDELAHLIETTTKYFPVKCRTFAMDFAANRDEDYEKLGEIIEELEVAILVNNVGLSHSIPVPFALTPKKEVTDIITVNCLATLRVTQLCLPGMIKRKQGLILTMGSFGGLLPTPLLATYSGSKSFLQHWSTALAAELEGSGIRVQFIVSYLVTTAMSKIKKPSVAIPHPQYFVESVLQSIGRRGGSTKFAYSCTPYWSHAIMQWWLENVIGVAGEFVVRRNRGFHQSIRTRALKKAAREAKKA